MIAYPDTSFLFAFYLRQSNSPAAAAQAATMRSPLPLAAPLLFEFRQALRFQVWRNKANAREGVSPADARAALLQLEEDLRTGIAAFADCDFPEVFRVADELSERHTITGGHRSFDILHVATALNFRATEFLTFDANQRKLARAERLKIKP